MGRGELLAAAPKLSYTLAKVRHGAVLGALVDGVRDERFVFDVLRAIRRRRRVPAASGRLVFSATEPFRQLDLTGDLNVIGAEQSNVSVILADKLMLKIYRRLREGAQPEIEVSRFLTEVAGFANTPAFYGCAEYVADTGEPAALAGVFAFVRNQGDAWGVTTDALERHLEEFAILPLPEPGVTPAEQPIFIYPLDLAATLGRRTAEMHTAFATPTDDPAFAAEAVGEDDLARWISDTRAESDRVMAYLAARRPACRRRYRPRSQRSSVRSRRSTTGSKRCVTSAVPGSRPASMATTTLARCWWRRTT